MKAARISIHFFLVLLVTSSLGQVLAGDCLDYSDHPHWIAQLETPVFAEDVLVEGNLAYLAIRTAGIVIADITDPWHPVQIGSLGGTVDPDWTATADRLALAGHHLFVADGAGRLVHVVDVSDPTGPFPVAQISTGVYPDGLALAGNYLYIAVQYTGVVIFDITDPSTPQPAGTLPVTLAHNVAVFDDLLYATGYTNSVSIFDLAEPSAPVLLSQVVFPDEFETYDVAVLGHLAYVAGPAGTWIVDVSEPDAASLVGSIPQGATSITIEDNWAYLTPFNLEIFDLTNPLTPVRVSYLPKPSQGFFSPVKQVAVSGGFAFTAADDAGLLVADLAQRISPPLTTNLDFPATVERIRIWGDYVLAADRTEGLLVVDITDPAVPFVTASLASEDARAVIAAGQLAYLADGGDGLKIIDLSIPSAPHQIGHLDTYSRVATGLALNNNRIYLAAGLSGLMVIDVAVPSDPTLLGQVETEARAQDVCLEENFAFVADGEGGLQVVDVSDPGAPFVAAALDFSGRQESVVLDGNTLFIGGSGTGLRAVDVTNPTAPEVLGWLSVEALDIALDGPILMAAGGNGVTLVDRSDPASLRTVGFLPTWEECPTAVVSDAFMLAAGDHLHTALKQCPSASIVPDVAPDLSAWARLTGHPNPFNPRIEVSFELQTLQWISLEVYDLAGRRVTTLAAGEHTSATHQVSWDGNDSRGNAAPAGCYFLLLRGAQNTHSLKVMLVR